MKAFFLSLVFSVLAIGLSAQANRSYDIEDFTRLRIGGPYDVTLKTGNNPSIELIGDEEVIERTTVKIEGRELIVKFENDRWKWSGSRDKVQVNITFTELERLDVSGACQLNVMDKITAEDFDLDVSGASDADIELDSRFLKVDISGASTVNLSGESEEQEIDISGASSFKARDFQTERTYVDASGASNATVYVKERLRADANGASSIYYYGDPEYVDAESSGAGSVRRRG